MTVGAEEYRAALRRHPAGVAVITMASPDGPVGFTATSLSSLSLDPPLVCFNITHTSSSIAALRRARSVVAHLLAAHQIETARRFSRAAGERFSDTSSWSSLPTGEPLLHGTPTSLRLEVRQFVEAGDSTLVIGEIVEIRHDGAEITPTPLLYHDGGFLAGQPIGD